MLYEKETYTIRSAVYEVYRTMGCGFLEAVYQECLTREFKDRNIPFESQKKLHLIYKGQELLQSYRPDFVCYDTIIVELKAARHIAPEYEAQILNYLKATGLSLGLLVNFGSYPKANVKRFVL